MVTKIVCRATDCIFNEDKFCTLDKIVYDPDEGCLAYEILADLADEDDDDDLLDDDDDLELELDDDDDLFLEGDLEDEDDDDDLELELDDEEDDNDWKF